MRGQVKLDAERTTNAYASTGHEGRTRRVDSSEHAARAALLDHGLPSEGMVLNAQEETRKREREYQSNDAMTDICRPVHEATLQVGLQVAGQLRSLHGDNTRLRDDNTRLQGELDTARIEMQNRKSECATKLEVLEKSLTALKCQKLNGELNLKRIKEEQQTLKTELEETRRNCEAVKDNFLNFRETATSSKTDLEKKLASMQEEADQLNFSLDMTRKSLDEEKDKTLCQICLEFPKDTICFPCLHLNYCLPCLEKHRKQSNSCPSCRAWIMGILRLDMCI